LPGQELGELRLEHAEFVTPRVAQDPELKSAFCLMSAYSFCCRMAYDLM